MKRHKQVNYIWYATFINPSNSQYRRSFWMEVLYFEYYRFSLYLLFLNIFTVNQIIIYFCLFVFIVSYNKSESPDTFIFWFGSSDRLIFLYVHSSVLSVSSRTNLQLRFTTWSQINFTSSFHSRAILSAVNSFRRPRSNSPESWKIETVIIFLSRYTLEFFSV